MTILKQLMEMDPFMRPYGGPVDVPNNNYPPARFDNDTLRNLLYRNAAEEEEIVEPEEEKDPHHSEIISFIKNFEDPTPEEFEQAARDCGMDVEDFSLSILDIARAALNGIGKNDDMPDEEFSAKELQMGIEVEMEHTNNATIAKMIAKDHLMELPDYYTRLKKAEKD